MPTQRIRGTRARAEVLELLRNREPQTSPALAHLLRPHPKRHTKLWVSRDGGRITGVLLVYRYTFDRWYGLVYLDDVSDAPAFARVLDRSAARGIGGPVDGAEAVIDHSRRVRSSVRLWFYVWPADVPESAGDEVERNAEVTVRPATEADLEGMVDIVAKSEHSGSVPRWVLRRVARQRLGDVRVAVKDRKIVGMVSLGHTDKFDIYETLNVLPEARGQRIGTALLVDAGVQGVRQGRGMCGLRALSNGQRVGHDKVTEHAEAFVWAGGDLHPPQLFKGHNRLRKLAERLAGGAVVAPRSQRSTYSVLPDQRRRPGRRS